MKNNLVGSGKFPKCPYVKLGGGQGGDRPPLETGVWVWSPPRDPQKFGKIMRLMHKNAIKLKNKAPPPEIFQK